MKTKLIKDSTFNTHIIHFIGTYEELSNHLNDKYSYEISDESTGKFIVVHEHKKCYIWAENNDKAILAHEVFHAVCFWMEFLDTKLTEDTEEIYATLLSFYLNKIY